MRRRTPRRPKRRRSAATCRATARIPPQQPLIEAGQGEAEGFELAEKDLEDIASHGDEHRFPDNVPSAPEEPQSAEYGEADEAIPSDE